jgi:hypothetical protein
LRREKLFTRITLASHIYERYSSTIGADVDVKLCTGASLRMPRHFYGVACPISLSAAGSEDVIGFDGTQGRLHGGKRCGVVSRVVVPGESYCGADRGDGAATATCQCRLWFVFMIYPIYIYITEARGVRVVKRMFN